MELRGRAGSYLVISTVEHIFVIKTQGCIRVLGEAENAGKLVQEPVACGEWWGNTGRFEYCEVGSHLRNLTVTQ